MCASASRTADHSAMGISGGLRPCAMRNLRSNSVGKFRQQAQGFQPGDAAPACAGIGGDGISDLNFVAERHIRILARRHNVFALWFFRQRSGDFDVSVAFQQPRNPLAGSLRTLTMTASGPRFSCSTRARRSLAFVARRMEDKISLNFIQGTESPPRFAPARAAEFPHRTTPRGR